MTGSYSKKDTDARLKGLPRLFSQRSKKRSGRTNLLYLRAKPAELQRPDQDLSGAFYTFGGVCIGLVIGYVGYHYRWSNRLFSLKDPAFLSLAAPTFLGGAVGALAAWMRARRRLVQALVTSEGFRLRLMSVERNQALWISLSAVLHDVRNPLHNIQLLIENLGLPEADVDRIRGQIVEQLERINMRVRRVVAQVAEFSGEISRRPVSVAAVLTEVADMVRPLARQSRVDLVVDAGEDAMVVADPKFLVQAIDHLILNSLQILSVQPATVPRSLWVQVHRAEGRVEMWVEDSGPGLPAEVRERLFEPLSTSRASGMGLGLAIAHALASAAGAPLSLGHTGEAGTRFVLQFQVA